MKRILSATATILFLSTAAFAQETQTPAPATPGTEAPAVVAPDSGTTGSTTTPTTGDVRTTLGTAFGTDTAITDLFVDESGTDRPDADFTTRMAALTPEQMQAVKDGCTKAQADTASTLPASIMERCKTIMAPAQ
jgi:hypothetical protein